MTELSCKTASAGNELSVRQQGGANAFRDGEQDRIADAIQMTEPQL